MYSIEDLGLDEFGCHLFRIQGRIMRQLTEREAVAFTGFSEHQLRNPETQPLKLKRNCIRGEQCMYVGNRPVHPVNPNLYDHLGRSVLRAEWILCHRTESCDAMHCFSWLTNSCGRSGNLSIVTEYFDGTIWNGNRILVLVPALMPGSELIGSEYMEGKYICYKDINGAVVCWYSASAGGWVTKQGTFQSAYLPDLWRPYYGSES